MTKEETYNNMCVATMANLQGFYREDKALYLGTIDRKNKVDRFLLTQAFFCSNINENCKIYVSMNIFDFLKLKKETKRDDLVRISPRRWLALAVFNAKKDAFFRSFPVSRS